MADFSLDARQRKFLWTETTISTTMNGLVPAVLLWSLYASYPVPLQGSQGLMMSLLRATPVVTGGMTIIMTLIMRMRIRKGAIPGLSWRRADHPWFRYMPNNLLLRAILFAALGVVILIPCGTVVAIVLDLCPMGRAGFVLYNFFYGACLGALFTPFILIGAMTDVSAQNGDKPVAYSA